MASALPAIAGAFGDVERVSWIVAAHLVASTVEAPVYGRLGDALGRRRLPLAALILFIAAPVLCAFAQGVLSHPRGSVHRWLGRRIRHQCPFVCRTANLNGPGGTKATGIVSGLAAASGERI